MPRRIYTYLPDMGWDGWNFLSTVGALILAVGIFLFIFNVFNSLRAGESAPDNPWNAGGLEWATASPPPPYNFDALPVVQSRYPLWEAPETISTFEFKSNPDRRETLGTTALDAVPEMRVLLPGNTIIPFLTAVATILMLLSALIHTIPMVFFTVILLILIGAWHWPRGRERSVEWIKSPETELQVSTVVKGKGKHPPYFYGMLLFIAIEATEFAR